MAFHRFVYRHQAGIYGPFCLDITRSQGTETFYGMMITVMATEFNFNKKGRKGGS